MEFREMKSLATLAETGSIQEAAKQCNLSAPAVHKHLKAIESELGVRLYERSPGGLRITEAGRVVLPFAKELLLQHDAVFAAIAEWKQGSSGVVRVGAGPTFSNYLLPPLVKRFRRKFPGVDIYVETGDSDHLMSRLRNGELDLAFDLAAAAGGDCNLEQVAQWESSTGFIASKAHALPSNQLKHLEKMPFILFRQNTLMEEAVRNYMASLNFRPATVMRSDSAEAIKAMVRAGLGVSILFLWNVESETSGLTVLPVDVPPLSLRMALIRSKARYSSKALTAFIQMASKANWKNLHRVKTGSG